jgi:hypothetical protein
VNFFIAADFRVSQAGRPGFLLGGVQWGYFLQKTFLFKASRVPVVM